MSILPGTIARRGRSDYYRSEARRIESLAAAEGAGSGRDRFLEVAQEYRLLAAWYETLPVFAEPQALTVQPSSRRPS